MDDNMIIYNALSHWIKTLERQMVKYEIHYPEIFDTLNAENIRTQELAAQYKQKTKAAKPTK